MAPAISPSGEGLVFLLGLPRSGTTLLSLMLDNHPDISSPPEPWLMLALAELGRVPARHPANSAVLGTAVDHFFGENDRILAARAAATAVYAARLERTGCRVFIDKTPRYALIPDFLLAVFPRARFIWLRRDPFDMAASYLTTWNVDLAAVLAETRDVPELFDITTGLDRLITFYERHSDKIHVVHYEKLVAKPEAELAKMLRYIGIAANQEALTNMISLDACKRAPHALGDHKIRDTSSPNTNSLGTWRKIFDRPQLQILIDAIGADRMIALGYATTVVNLRALGIGQSTPNSPEFYRAAAEARFRARQRDIAELTTHRFDACARAAANPERLARTAKRRPGIERLQRCAAPGEMRLKLRIAWHRLKHVLRWVQHACLAGRAALRHAPIDAADPLRPSKS